MIAVKYKKINVIEAMIKKVIPSQDKVVFNASEACGYTGLSWNSLKKLLEAGEISHKRAGRRYLITRSAIDVYLHSDELEAIQILQDVRLKW